MLLLGKEQQIILSIFPVHGPSIDLVPVERWTDFEWHLSRLPMITQLPTDLGLTLTKLKSRLVDFN